jgi:helicase
VKAELPPLVAIRGIGRVRARRLFNNGIMGPDGIRAAGIDHVASIIGRGIAEQVFAKLGRASPEAEGEQASLGHFWGDSS